MSAGQRRDMLWNSIDPGDPYDIKKSLIARIPGDKKIFMGDHLELVVLFQGAEIERLIESLAEYKLKYKELEKVDLDRHSYEVQIKQLTEMCDHIDPLKTEINRLKDFVARQTQQLEESRRRGAIDEDIHRKYDQALDRLQTLSSENNSLKGELNVTRTKLSAMERSKNREIDDLRFAQREQRVNSDKEIRDLRSKYQIQVTQLQNQIVRCKERLENERTTIQSLRMNHHKLTIQNQQYQSRLTQSVHLESQVGDYTREMERLKHEIDRTHNMYGEKSRENIQLKGQVETKDLDINRANQSIRNLEQRIAKYEEDMARMRSSASSPVKNNDYDPSQTKIDIYQEKLVLMTQEVERLNYMVESKNRQGDDSARKLIRLEEQNVYLRGQHNADNLSPSRPFQPYNPSSPNEEGYLPNPDIHYPSSPGSATRPNLDNLETNSELRRLQYQVTSLQQELEIQRRRQEEATEEYDIQIHTLKSEVERLERDRRVPPMPNPDLAASTRANDDLRRKLSELQNKNQSLSREVDRLNNTLRQKEEDSNSLSSQINRLNLQNTRLNKVVFSIPDAPSLQQSKADKNLRVDYDNLRSKLVPLSEEITRLNEVLKVKVAENVQLMGENRQMHAAMVNYESQAQEAENEIEEYRRRVGELEDAANQPLDQLRIQKIVVENRRLEEELSSKNREIQFLREQATVNILPSSPSGLSPKPNIPPLPTVITVPSVPTIITVPADVETSVIPFRNEISRLEEVIRRKDIDYSRLENDLQEAQNRYNRIKNEGSSAMSQSRKAIFDYENAMTEMRLKSQSTLRKYESTIMELKTRLQQVINDNQRITVTANNQQGDMYGQIQGYQEKAALLSTELQRLSQFIHQKDEEINNLKRFNNTLKQSMNNTSTQQLQQSQNLENTFRTQVAESNRAISNLREENQGFRRQITSYENQLQSFNKHGGNMQQEMERLSSSLTQKIEQINAYERSYREHIQYREELEAKVQEQHHIIVEYKNKFSPLPTELERVNGLLRQKLEENESLKMNLNQYSLKYNELVKQYEGVVNTANSHHQTREQEVQNKGREYEQIISQLKRDIELSQRNEHARYETVSRQLERLNNVLGGQLEEIQMVTGENNSLKNQLQQTRGEAERHISELSQQLDRVKQALARRMDEEKGAFIGEIERLNNTLRIKVQESQEWQTHAQQYERRIQQITQAYETLQRTYNQLVPEYEASRGRMTQFQQKFKRLTEEFQKLSDIIRDLKQQNQGLGQENYNLKVEIGRFGNLEEMNRRLQGEIDRLNKEKTGLEEDITQLRIRYADEAALQKRLNEHLSLFVVLFAEVQSLRKRVKEKEKEVEEVRRSSLAPFKV